MLNLKRKNNSVNLEGLHSAFDKVAPILRVAWKMWGAEAVVTSAKDGKHSANSAHYNGLAIDLRTWNLGDHPNAVAFAGNLAETLEAELGEEWYVVVEDDHIHLEYAPLGKAPNIKGWVKGKNFYIQAGA